MKNLFSIYKRMIRGNWGIYLSMFFFQFMVVFFSVFTTFLSKVLVDTLTHELNQAVYLEKAVIALLSGGNGASWLYDHTFILPIAVSASALSSASFLIARNFVRAKAASKIFKTMQLEVFSRINAMEYASYKSQKEGDLIQTATRDLDLVRRFMMMQTSQMTYTLFVVTLGFVILLQISWKLTLASFAILPFFFVYSFFMIKQVRKKYRKSDDAEAVVVDALSQNLDGVRVVKAYNEENKEIEAFNEKLSIYGKHYRNHTLTSAMFYSSTDVFIFFARSFSLVFALILAFLGEITVGTIAIAFTFVNMMVWPLRESATTLSNLGQTLASCDRIMKVLEHPQEDIHSGEIIAIQGDIVFDHVSFAYPDEPDQMILSDVSFHIHPGESVALMGKTGSGKTTIFQLLCRLYEPTSGTIYIDGKPLSSLQKESLRKQIAPVWQDPFLFSKSIEENITITIPDSKKEEIEKAAKIAGIEDSILSFPEGYNTPVGEKGVTLSGGQRQRIALARALLASPPILLLDDSSSAVDMQTDLSIRRNLKKNKSTSTTFLITHRIASAKDCQLILVLEKGKIAQQGKHEDLLKQEGLYSRIAQIQEGGMNP